MSIKETGDVGACGQDMRLSSSTPICRGKDMLIGRKGSLDHGFGLVSAALMSAVLMSAALVSVGLVPATSLLATFLYTAVDFNPSPAIPW